MQSKDKSIPRFEDIDPEKFIETATKDGVLHDKLEESIKPLPRKSFIIPYNSIIKSNYELWKNESVDLADLYKQSEQMAKYSTDVDISDIKFLKDIINIYISLLRKNTDNYQGQINIDNTQNAINNMLEIAKSFATEQFDKQEIICQVHAYVDFLANNS